MLRTQGRTHGWPRSASRASGGPSTYEVCLAYELARRGHLAVRQLRLPVIYKGIELDAGFRIDSEATASARVCGCTAAAVAFDLLVDREVVVEVKSTPRIEALHQAQLLTYLRLSGHQVGLLLNFNVRQLRDGIKRLVMDPPAA